MQNIIEFKQARSEKINWHTLTAVVIFHVVAVWALFVFSWQNLAVAVVLWWISGSLGVGLGYHRLLTHKGFKTPQWFEYFLAVCGTLAVQSGPLSWVTTHRLHHAFTDTEKDPHSPIRGIFWSHMGWIFKGEAQLHDDATHQRYSPDLMRRPFYVVLDKYYWVPTVILAAVLLAVGGWSMVLWGVFFRTVFLWHMTWLVNSATHIWGSRRFETRDTSTNNVLVALLTWGEGWHNNHHAYPRSSRHGLRWYEVDFNWIQIRFFEKVGLMKEIYATDLNEMKTEAVSQKIAA